MRAAWPPARHSASGCRSCAPRTRVSRTSSTPPGPVHRRSLLPRLLARCANGRASNCTCLQTVCTPARWSPLAADRACGTETTRGRCHWSETFRWDLTSSMPRHAGTTSEDQHAEREPGGEAGRAAAVAILVGGPGRCPAVWHSGWVTSQAVIADSMGVGTGQRAAATRGPGTPARGLRAGAQNAACRCWDYSQCCWWQIQELACLQNPQLMIPSLTFTARPITPISHRRAAGQQPQQVVSATSCIAVRLSCAPY